MSNEEIVKSWAIGDADTGLTLGQDDFESFKELCLAAGFEGDWELFNVYLDTVEAFYNGDVAADTVNFDPDNPDGYPSDFEESLNESEGKIYYLTKIRNKENDGPVAYVGADKNAAIAALKDESFSDYLDLGFGGPDSVPVVYQFTGNDANFAKIADASDTNGAFNYFDDHMANFKEITTGQANESLNEGEETGGGAAAALRKFEAGLSENLEEDLVDDDLEDVVNDDLPGGDSEDSNKVLADLIIDEKEAIDGYNKAIDSLEGDAKTEEVLRHIEDEELEHVEELSKVVAGQEDEVVTESIGVNSDEAEAKDREINNVPDSKKTYICWYDGEDIGRVYANNESEAYKEFETLAAEVGLDLDDCPAEVKIKELDEDLDFELDDEEVEESLEETIPQDLSDDRTPVSEQSEELAEPVDGTEIRKHEAAIKESAEIPVVKCPVNKVITHSEDEKPLDCEMKKKPLDKPLTEGYNLEQMTEFIDLCDELGIKNGGDLTRFSKENPGDLLTQLRNYKEEVGKLNLPDNEKGLFSQTIRELRKAVRREHEIPDELSDEEVFGTKTYTEALDISEIPDSLSEFNEEE